MTKPSEKIRIGISSCLLGHEVRYDGNHKRDSYILGTLGQFFEFQPYCPETAIGMGVPREPIRLEGDPESPRAVGVSNKQLDVTEALRQYGREVAPELAPLSGYILKNRSPSCGMERVKVYRQGAPAKQGRGLFAAEIMTANPLLPVEEEGRLGDPVLRENFLERVFAYHDWQQLTREPLTAGRLVAFHSRYKLSLMAHGQQHYRELGRLVADAGKGDLGELAERYVRGFMEALAKTATRRRHTNVLQHLAGYLKRALDKEDKAELVEVIEQYRQGQLPLIVPVTLLKHHFRRHPDPYIDTQVYLNPHPPELMLRNQL